jgi:hypothetical protein
MFADMGDPTVRQYYENKIGYSPKVLPVFTVFNQIGTLQEVASRKGVEGKDRSNLGAIIYEPPVDIGAMVERSAIPLPRLANEEQNPVEYAKNMAAKQNVASRLVGMGVLPEENANAIVATLAKREEERLLAEAQADAAAEADQDAQIAASSGKPQDMNTLLAGASFFTASSAKDYPELPSVTLPKMPQVAPQILLSDTMPTPQIGTDALSLASSLTLSDGSAAKGADVTLGVFTPSLSANELLALRDDIQENGGMAEAAASKPLIFYGPAEDVLPNGKTGPTSVAEMDSPSIGVIAPHVLLADTIATPAFNPDAFRIEPTFTMTGQPSVVGLSPDVALGAFEPSLSADALLALRKDAVLTSLADALATPKAPLAGLPLLPAGVMIAPEVDLAALRIDPMPLAEPKTGLGALITDATLAGECQPSMDGKQLSELAEAKKAAAAEHDFAAILAGAEFTVAAPAPKQAPVVASAPSQRTPDIMLSSLGIGPISFNDALPGEAGTLPSALAAVSLPAAGNEPVVVPQKGIVTPPESSPSVIASIMQSIEADDALQRTDLVSRLSGFADGQVQGPERYTQNPGKRFKVIEDTQAALIYLDLLDNRTKRNPNNEPDGFGGERTFAALRKAQSMMEGRVIRVGDEDITIRKPVDVFDQTTAKLLMAMTFAGGDADKTLAVLEEMAQTDKQLMLALQDPTRKEGKALAMHAVEYKSDATTALDPKVADALQAAAKGKAATASGVAANI